MDALHVHEPKACSGSGLPCLGVGSLLALQLLTMTLVPDYFGHGVNAFSPKQNLLMRAISSVQSASPAPERGEVDFYLVSLSSLLFVRLFLPVYTMPKATYPSSRGL